MNVMIPGQRLRHKEILKGAELPTRSRSKVGGDSGAQADRPGLTAASTTMRVGGPAT